MKTKYEGHTAGPWQEGRSDMATVVDGTKSKWVYSQDGQYVAVASGHVHGEWECVMSNARLIADAPALLAALVKIVEANAAGIEALQRNDANGRRDSVVRLAFAIAEARKLIGGGE